MKIVELTAENIKRIAVARIKPDGSLVTIGGKNGQGKTSVLDSIEYALGGKSHVPSKPVRDGAGTGRIVLNLNDEIIVTRTFNEETGKSSLKITSADGQAKYNSPQALLDKLVGDLTFDPLEFSRMDAAGQLDALRALVGADLTKIDSEYEEAYQLRRDVNRELKEKKAVAEATRVSDDLPDEAPDVSELTQKIREADAHNNALREAKASFERDHEKHLAASQSLARTGKLIETKKNDLARIIKETEEEIARLQESFDSETDRLAEEHQELSERKEQIDSEKTIDVAELQLKVTEYEATAEAIRARRKYLATVAEVEKLEANAQAITDELESLKAKRTEVVAAAELPVEGLELTDAGVLFDGIPFDQLSAAEQLRLSVAMAIRMNPELRVMLIRDGSLLDEDNLALIATMAEEADAQVWLERVGDGAEVSVVMEDGRIRGAEDPEGYQETPESAPDASGDDTPTDHTPASDSGPENGAQDAAEEPSESAPDASEETPTTDHSGDPENVAQGANDEASDAPEAKGGE